MFSVTESGFEKYINMRMCEKLQTACLIYKTLLPFRNDDELTNRLVLASGTLQITAGATKLGLDLFS